MSLYDQLKQQPPKLEVSKKSKEVILDIVSVMCDNKKKMHFKDKGEGFKMHSIDAFSNWQIKGHDKTDLEWLADDGQWQEVIRIVNSGTQLVHKIRQR